MNLKMIAGLIATRAPSSTQGATAYAELGVAVELFEQGAHTSARVKASLV